MATQTGPETDLSPADEAVLEAFEARSRARLEALEDACQARFREHLQSFFQELAEALVEALDPEGKSPDLSRVLSECAREAD